MAYWMPITKHGADYENLLYHCKQMRSEKAWRQYIRYWERCMIADYYNNQGGD